MPRVMLLQASILVLGAAAAAVAGAPQRAADSRMPGLAPFTFDPPPAVAFARLRFDVGMFHPFTGPQSRQAWDGEFYALLNKVSAGQMDLRHATAAALGALGDDGSMVLDPDEGVGTCFLPVIFEPRADGLWIIGGSKAVVEAPFGPITTINGEDISSWMAGHIGADRPLAQQMAALLTISQSPSPKGWAFTAPNGQVLTLKSGATIPTDAWVDGGWKGTPVHALPSLEAAGLGKIASLDLRTISWGPGSPAMPGALFAIDRAAKHDAPAFETRWVHRGFTDGMTQDEYSATQVSEGALVPSDLPDARAIVSTEPTALIASKQIVSLLGGFALPKGQFVPAECATYSLGNGVTVRLVTTFYSDRGPNAVYSLYGGPIEFISPERKAGWEVLTVQAAKNLAAATILDFFQHYGFMRTDLQESAFKAIANLPAEPGTVQDLVMRAAYFAREPHTSAFTMDLRDFTVDDWDQNSAQKHGRLPFIGTTTADGALLVLRPAAGVPLAVGAKVTAINGQPTKDLIATMSQRVPTPDNSFRIVKDMGMLFPYNTPYSITFKNPGDQERTEKMSPATYDGPWATLDPSLVEALAKAGWTYIANKKDINTPEMFEGLKHGKNYLFDERFDIIWPSSRKAPFPYAPEDEGFIRTTDHPMTWGQAAESNFAYERQVVDRPGTGERYPGKVAILVWGNTQSSMESAAMSMRQRFLSNAFIVGTPSSGITGPCTYLKLPLGGSERYMLASPTGMWPTMDGQSIQYKGVPMDFVFPANEIGTALSAGSKDPYITVFLRHQANLK